MRRTISDESGEPAQTKRERSRERLLDAAVDCLAERGYAGATAGAIANYAGMSHGALFDHFGTKDELLIAALLRVLPRTFREVSVEMLASVPADPRPVAAAIKLTWRLYHTTPMQAWTELIVAGRTHPRLARAIIDADPAFRRELEGFTSLLFPKLAGTAELGTVYDLSRATLLGLVILESTLGPAAGAEEICQRLITQLESVMAAL